MDNLLELVTHDQIHHTFVDTMTSEIIIEFADVFKDELGVLKHIEAVVTVQESTSPRFHKPQPVPFDLREKVEKHLDKQVKKGELIPTDKSEWAAPIIVDSKKDGEIRICSELKCQSTLFYIPKCTLCRHQRN